MVVSPWGEGVGLRGMVAQACSVAVTAVVDVLNVYEGATPGGPLSVGDPLNAGVLNLAPQIY